mmetsp:Transcript_30290/g.78242  ORF Transcript_30290/g.78242 Transcript_30290/m.78242 type:complete len:186 (+) Transcript_30290:46-603(+)
MEVRTASTHAVFNAGKGAVPHGISQTLRGRPPRLASTPRRGDVLGAAGAISSRGTKMEGMVSMLKQGLAEVEKAVRADTLAAEEINKRLAIEKRDRDRFAREVARDETHLKDFEDGPISALMSQLSVTSALTDREYQRVLGKHKEALEILEREFDYSRPYKKGLEDDRDFFGIPFQPARHPAKQR